MSAADPVNECGAKTRAGTPCKKPLGWGTRHVGVGRCKLHGGASPQAELTGAITLATLEAKVMGVPIDITETEAILACIRITAGEIQYASERVAELEDAMVSTMFGPVLNTWITTRQRAMDRLVNYSAVALKAGVEERRVRIAEETGQALAAVIRAVLAERGLDPNAPEVRESVRRHLTLIQGEPA